MSYIVLAFSVLVAFGLLQVSYQCSCEWGFVNPPGEERIPISMCFTRTYVVAIVNGKENLEGISGDLQIDGKRRFDVTITRNYTKNGVEEIPDGLQTSLYSPIPSSLCGVDLEIGKTYFISVYEDMGNKLTFNACSFVRESDEVTNAERKVMEGEIKC